MWQKFLEENFYMFSSEEFHGVCDSGEELRELIKIIKSRGKSSVLRANLV